MARVGLFFTGLPIKRAARAATAGQVDNGIPLLCTVTIFGASAGSLWAQRADRGRLLLLSDCCALSLSAVSGVVIALEGLAALAQGALAGLAPARAAEIPWASEFAHGGEHSSVLASPLVSARGDSTPGAAVDFCTNEIYRCARAVEGLAAKEDEGGLCALAVAGLACLRSTPAK